jgi:uncharacterized protein
MRWALVITGSVWTFLHVYVGLRLLGGLSGSGALAAWLVLATLAFAPYAALATMRVQRAWSWAVQWIGFTAVGLSSLLIVLVAITDLFRVRSWGVGTGTVSLGVVAAAVALTALGMWRAQRPRVVVVSVPIAGLPADLQGFRILQLSDLHVGPTIGRRFVAAVVERANELDADIVALTGDLADGTVAVLRQAVAPLGELRARYGKFFVSGNHDYYWDLRGWVAELERLGFHVLMNEHRVLQRGGARLLVAGVTDASASHRVPGQASDPLAALAGAPPTDVKVLLAHQPRSAFAARPAGFDLQLSGHTHGGQYFPFNYVVRLFQPFVAGLHRLDRMWLYVSRGTGYWGPPLRLLAPSEITLIELRAAAR